MKKILFISTRNPFSERYSGDVIRAKKFIYFLVKIIILKLLVQILKNLRKEKVNLIMRSFKSPNLILKIFYIFRSFFKT